MARQNVAECLCFTTMPLAPAHVVQIRSKASGFVELRGGVRVPPRFRAIYVPHDSTATTPRPPHLASDFVEAEIEVVDGVGVVTNLTLHGRVTKSTLRDLGGSFDQLVDLLLASAAHLLAIEDGSELETDLDPVLDDLAKLRRRRIDVDLLRQVAEVVRSNPKKPTEGVQRTLHTSHRNATRWISEARRRGFIEEG